MKTLANTKITDLTAILIMQRRSSVCWHTSSLSEVIWRGRKRLVAHHRCSVCVEPETNVGIRVGCV